MMSRRITRLILAIGVTTIIMVGSVASAGTPTPDAFHANSFWNQPIASNAVVDPNSDGIINFLMNDNDLNGCLTLAGHPGNSWGMPSFVADASTRSTTWCQPTTLFPPNFIAPDTERCHRGRHFRRRNGRV